MSVCCPLPTYPPFLAGREAEIARLHTCLTQALHGRRQIILLPGEAGIGKTALVDTFLHQLEDSEALWVGRGQCIEHHGEGEAYLPFLEALGRLGRAPGGERLVACLRQHAPTWLAQLPALCPASEHDTRHDTARGIPRTRMLRELAEALEELSKERPVVLLLEDLHWSDPATMEALTLLARRRDTARLLVLGTYRPRELRLYNHPFQGVTQELVVHGLVGEVPLGPLPQDAVATYLVQRGVAPQLESDVVTWVYQRTEGHPFFLVQVVEYLAQQGLFRSIGFQEEMEGLRGKGAVGGAIMQAVPPGIQQLLEAHLGRLAPAEQAVLEAGSVVGTVFTAANVAVALQMPAAGVEEMCESLSRRGQFLEDRGLVLQIDGTASGRYGFRYALYREAIYKRLSAGRRERLHLLIGGRAEAVPRRRLLQRLS